MENFNFVSLLAMVMFYIAPLALVVWAVLGVVRNLRESARNSRLSAAAQQELARLVAESVALQRENNALLRPLLERQI